MGNNFLGKGTNL